MKKHYILFLFLTLLFAGAQAQPIVKAPTPPARNASDVISLFSEAYTNIAGIDWFPNWGQSTTVSDIMVEGNATKQYLNLNYQGVQFATPVNASGMSTLHVDIWTPNCTAFDFFLINTSPGLVEQKVTISPALSGWQSVDIPLSDYNTIALNNIGQFKFVGTPFGSSTVYLDNIYFWKSSNAPTITGFDVPAKLVGDAPFALTAPTSNSPGAFTYSSGNTAVATVSGNMVTIVGAGTSIITANQAAGGSFIAGSTSAALVVTYPPPAVAAPTPTLPQSNVLSLFSDVYTNVAAIDWFPNWGQSTVVTDVQVAGNTTKKYENLNYQGVQFAAPLDVSGMLTLHLDVWSPNATAFDIYLINTSPATVEQKYTIVPAAGWNSVDIPLTSFNTIALNNVGQFKLVAEPFGTSTVYLDNIYFFKPVSLPVQLTEFKAIQNGNAAVLQWKTLSESNNKGFAVQRSADGNSWAEIGFVKGRGNANSASVYTLTDNAPLKSMNYYRLKQTDNDGKYSFSTVATVKFGQKMANISFYPNPAKSVLNVLVAYLETNAGSLTLSDAAGKAVRAVTIQPANVNRPIAINVQGVTKGVYYLTLKDGTTTTTGKVVID